MSGFVKQSEKRKGDFPSSFQIPVKDGHRKVIVVSVSIIAPGTDRDREMRTTHHCASNILTAIGITSGRLSVMKYVYGSTWTIYSRYPLAIFERVSFLYPKIRMQNHWKKRQIPAMIP
jgi:hypothetical protein